LMVGCEKTSPRMLKLAAKYADLWNTGYMGGPETMSVPIANIGDACKKVGRDPVTLGLTAFIGLWFSDLQEKKPGFFDNPLTGTVQENATAMRDYAKLGLKHIMFQIEPYSSEARRRLTEALKLYHSMTE